MIFKQWQQVLDGTKTQTRRICNKEDMILDGPSGRIGIWSHGLWRFKIGQQIPVIPKRTESAIRNGDGEICRVQITDIRREALRDITEADARAEGVHSVEEYRKLWDSINGKKLGYRWHDNPWVWVITFKRVS